jgi:vacuolar-type H+-ATPase subunit H
MPDESTASQEHAILQEVTAPLASLPDDSLPAVAGVEFPIVLRGYDRLAVDAYVKRTSQLVAELQATRSPEAAVRRGLERVGEEVSGILQRAHDAASQITAQSRSDAEDRMERARQEATQITADAERRLQELDAETDRIWAERQRIVDDAQQLARQLLSLAHSAAARFPAADDPDTTQEKPSRATGVVIPVAAPPEFDAAHDDLSSTALLSTEETLETEDSARQGAEPPNGLVERGNDLAEDPHGLAGDQHSPAEDLDELTEGLHAPVEGEHAPVEGEHAPVDAGHGPVEHPDDLAEDPDDPGATRVMPPITPSDHPEQY